MKLKALFIHLSNKTINCVSYLWNICFSLIQNEICSLFLSDERIVKHDFSTTLCSHSSWSCYVRTDTTTCAILRTTISDLLQHLELQLTPATPCVPRHVQHLLQPGLGIYLWTIIFLHPVCLSHLTSQQIFDAAWSDVCRQYRGHLGASHSIGPFTEQGNKYCFVNKGISPHITLKIWSSAAQKTLVVVFPVCHWLEQVDTTKRQTGAMEVVLIYLP